MEFVTTCLFGLEKPAGEDIDKLGYKRTKTIDGRVEFEAPPEAIARCNINFRYSERLYIKTGAFYAKTFTELFDGVKSIPWEEYIGKNDAFPVKGHCIKSQLYSVPDCQSIIKKSIVDRLSSRYGIKRFEETGVKYQIVFFMMNDYITMMIDTSGDPLFKRGYRLESGIAPIRETLAASMVTFSRPRENVVTVDPMCGSGTIPIEGALLATNTAPGINRSFISEKFGFIKPGSFENARDEARNAIVKSDQVLHGSDIDPRCIEIAKENAKRAGILDNIRFETADVTKYSPPEKDARGTLVSNPPYGERMSDIEAVARLEKEMGAAFEKTVPGWQMYFISSDMDFERNFGRRADKVRKLYNGMIKCNFYQYFKKKI